MKKRVLILGLIALLFLGSLAAVVGTAQAGCGTKKIDCRIEGAKKVGSSNFSMCYNWRNADCEPCNGGRTYPAKWCNKHFQECNGKCWGCYHGSFMFVHTYDCLDKHGNRHDPK